MFCEETGKRMKTSHTPGGNLCTTNPSLTRDLHPEAIKNSQMLIIKQIPPPLGKTLTKLFTNDTQTAGMPGKTPTVFGIQGDAV